MSDATRTNRTDSTLVSALRAAVADPARVKVRALDLHAIAHDASHFMLVPQAVVVAADAQEVGALFRATVEQCVPITFRSGGTSLSGQAISDGVLVDVRRNFKNIEVLDDGARVRVQPGVVVRTLNNRLDKYGRKFGPDPASESAATIGGVIANNSSGMACGTVSNTYETLESVTVVLPSGTVVDTGAADADDRLREQEPALYEGLLELAKRARDNAESVSIIRHQYTMKNTMGYGINSLLDFDRPAEILAHLIVGSEGTLGFVAEAVFRTVPKLPHVTTALLVFDGLEAAAASLPALVATGATTLELMDALSIKVGQQMQGAPAIVLDLEVEQHATLLVEYHADSPENLDRMLEVGMETVDTLGLTFPADFTTDLGIRNQLWNWRKGIIPAVGGTRPQGTNALLEDIVVPVPALARTCKELIRLFDKYEYENSVIFGHARDGNVHFILTDNFTTPVGLKRFEDFTEDLVDLVLRENGSLKAEHGTGRVMAPYVERQFGAELYDVMRRIKTLFDPVGLLNPGVIINDDPLVHLKDLKGVPAVAQEVDRCTECGWCEPVCPSRNVTLTPRQRIVSLRAIEQAKLDGDLSLVAEMEKDYEYDAIQTCAVDGMCQTACPVNINTGDLMKRLRRDDSTRFENALWNVAAKNWGVATRGAGLALTVARAVPVPLVLGPTRLARRLLGADTVPLYAPDLPRGGRTRASQSERKEIKNG